MSAEREMPRLLLVEDNFLVGLDLKARLSSLGYAVHGPVASHAEALRALDGTPYDVAVLDMTIADGTALPIAEVLQHSACPFVFVTGYASVADLPASMRHVPMLAKPLDPVALEAALSKVRRV